MPRLRHLHAQARRDHRHWIVAAAKAELVELGARATELKVTMAGLAEEREELTERAEEIQPQLVSLQSDILREVPSVQTARSQTNTVIARKLVVQKSLDLVNRRDIGQTWLSSSAKRVPASIAARTSSIGVTRRSRSKGCR
jgi:chromosome segregation ATPase